MKTFPSLDAAGSPATACSARPAERPEARRGAAVDECGQRDPGIVGRAGRVAAVDGSARPRPPPTAAGVRCPTGKRQHCAAARAAAGIHPCWIGSFCAHQREEGLECGGPDLRLARGLNGGSMLEPASRTLRVSRIPARRQLATHRAGPPGASARCGAPAGAALRPSPGTRGPTERRCAGTRSRRLGHAGEPQGPFQMAAAKDRKWFNTGLHFIKAAEGMTIELLRLHTARLRGTCLPEWSGRDRCSSTRSELVDTLRRAGRRAGLLAFGGGVFTRLSEKGPPSSSWARGGAIALGLARAGLSGKTARDRLFPAMTIARALAQVWDYASLRVGDGPRWSSRTDFRGATSAQRL